MTLLNAGGYSGFGFISGEGTRNFTNESNVTTQQNYEAKGLALHVGIHEQKGYRYEGSLSFIDTRSSIGVHSLLVGADIDAVYLPYDKKTAFILPYISLGIGTQAFIDSDFSAYDNNSTLPQGISFNAALGVYIPIEKSVEVNIAYRAKGILWDSAKSDFNEKITISEGMTSLYFGLNFKN